MVKDSDNEPPALAPLDYQSIVRTPRPGFSNPLDYAPKPRWWLARRFLRTWSATLLTLAAMAAIFAWFYRVILP